MSRLSQNVDISANDKGLQSGLKRAELELEGFLKRTGQMGEKFAKLQNLGRIAIGGAIGKMILEAPFDATRRYGEWMAGATSRAAGSLAAMREGKLVGGFTQTTTPGHAALLGDLAGEWERERSRRASVGDLFAGELAAGRQGGWFSDYVHNFNQGFRGIAASLPVFLNNLDKGYTKAARLSDLASYQAQADTDAEANYWLAMRVREGDPGAIAQTNALRKAIMDDGGASAQAEMVRLLRLSLQGF